MQALLHGTDDSDGALSMMKEAQKNLLSVKLPEFDEITRRLSDALSQTEEVCSEVRRFAENSDFSENEIEKIRIRLDLLRRLMLKYGDSEEKLLDSLESAQRNLEKIILSDKRITELSAALDKSTETLIALADKLSASRKSAALNFADKVTQVLHYLDIPNALFEVNISMGRYTKTGCDNIEFLIRTNAGEEKKPLHKIASGGELSRVMLAIKSVLADNDDVDTLIFDEIDAGISGRAAGKVGVQLKCVSKSRQVICVTHLAQIAAFATKHLLIEKNVNQNRTFTNVKPLDGEGRITEIARIMSGTEMTKNLYNSAKELLDRSQNHENL